MLTIAATVIIALAIASLVLTCQKSDPSQLSEPRGSSPLMGIQIVCGNCAGDGVRPKRTYMDHSGKCSTCGGTSYLLASNVYGRAQSSSEEVGDGERIVVSAKVLAFDSARVNKIAV